MTEFEDFQNELNKKASKYKDDYKAVYTCDDKEELNKAIEDNNKQYTNSQIYHMLDLIFECADEQVTKPKTIYDYFISEDGNDDVDEDNMFNSDNDFIAYLNAEAEKDIRNNEHNKYRDTPEYF